jgi:hypothetical protein
MKQDYQKKWLEGSGGFGALSMLSFQNTEGTARATSKFLANTTELHIFQIVILLQETAIEILGRYRR